jgi:hypothetical protein
VGVSHVEHAGYSHSLQSDIFMPVTYLDAMRWKRISGLFKMPTVEDVVIGAVVITIVLAILDALWRWVGMP